MPVTASRSKRRRKEARRARREAEHRTASRQGTYTIGMALHHAKVDAIHAGMERGRLARYAGVVFGALAFALGVVYVLAALI